MISVIKRGEFGYQLAMEGLSFNKDQNFDRMVEISEKLAVKDGGHNKFLESIYVWLDVLAPRYWWQEADTYRLSTKQSQSTMHTILKRPLNRNDFAGTVSADYLMYLNSLIENKNFVELKAALPEGFKQRRMWVMNYKCLRNIILQRRSHRLEEWREFCKSVIEQVDHPELLPKVKQGDEGDFDE